MCIAYLALGTDPQWPLYIAANRDEQHARPTRAAGPWPDHPDILGGLDLQAGGTWFAVQQQGRFALLTNYRDMRPATGQERSRGQLCSDFLVHTELSAQQYIQRIASQGDQYQGFNLIVGQWDTPTRQFICYYYSNRSQQAPTALRPGHYVVSNHLLNTDWPKSQRLAHALTLHLEAQQHLDIDAAYALLRDETKAPIEQLPNTGLTQDIEHLISSPFIISPEYGTRSSTIWMVNRDGQGAFHECSYNAKGMETERHYWPFVIQE